MKGLEIHERSNGFVHARLHYSSMPSRDPGTPEGAAWVAREKPKYDIRRWNTEMELSRKTYSGEGIYADDFNENIHVASQPYQPDLEFPLLCGWDFGGNQSCVVTQYIDGRLYVICEYPNVGWNSRTVVPEIMERRNLRFGASATFIDFLDPSAKDEGKTSTGIACWDVLLEMGLDARLASTNDPTRRIDAVLKLLTTMHKGLPRLILNPECKKLIQGFKGSYRYKEKIQANQKRPSIDKNSFSHISESLQYIAVELDNIHLQPLSRLYGTQTHYSGPSYRFKRI